MSIRLPALVVCLSTVMPCCVTDVRTRGPEVALAPLDQATSSFRPRADIRLRPVIGRCRAPLRAGSDWIPAGSIPQGIVHRPTEGLLVLDTGHSYEAWIVVAGTDIVGLYLPIEKRFVALGETVPLEK